MLSTYCPLCLLPFPSHNSITTAPTNHLQYAQDSLKQAAGWPGGNPSCGCFNATALCLSGTEMSRCQQTPFTQIDHPRCPGCLRDAECPPPANILMGSVRHHTDMVSASQGPALRAQAYPWLRGLTHNSSLQMHPLICQSAMGIGPCQRFSWIKSSVRISSQVTKGKRPGALPRKQYKVEMAL